MKSAIGPASRTPKIPKNRGSIKSRGIKKNTCLVNESRRPFIALFGNGDELYFEFAVMFMRTFLFMVIVNGVQVLSSNFFTAIGKAIIYCGKN